MILIGTIIIIDKNMRICIMKNKNKNGFTLIELLAVIVILVF